MDSTTTFIHDMESQRLRDRAQALAGREYRHLRALMLIGDTAPLAQAMKRLRQELPSEMTDDVSFQRLLNTMQREISLVSEQELTRTDEMFEAEKLKA